MSHARRSLTAALLVMAGSAVTLESMTSTTAGSQQLAASRYEKTAVAAPVVSGISAAVASDSVAHYLNAAYTQRRSGGSLVAAGLAAMTVAFVQFTNSDGMGMNGYQAATLGAGTVLGAVGSARLVRSRESFAIAAWWRQAQITARR